MEGMTILLIIIVGIVAFVLGYSLGNVNGYIDGIEVAAEAILDEEEKKMQEAFGPDCGRREGP